MNYQTHFLQLNHLLEKYQWLWRYQPFKDQTLTWPQAFPKLYNALLSLSDSELDSLQYPISLHNWAVESIPELNELTHLIEALNKPSTTCSDQLPNNEQLIRGIPLRKLEQIQLFSLIANNKNQSREWTDWCSGKGHLAKHLNHISNQPVTCIEIDASLCQQGEDWARKHNRDIRFYQRDMLTLTKEPLRQLNLDHTHHCALHACGDLHIHFIKQAVEHSWPQLSLAPCCYQKTTTERYQPLSSLAKQSKFQLNKTDLALSVQETATAKQRETTQRIALNEYRLGFDELQRHLCHSQNYLPLPSASVTWLEKGFEAFCHFMATKKDIALPSKLDYPYFLAAGKKRYNKVRRLELATHSFRRPLELWLILDRALFLEESGYKVEILSFCEREVSARNVMIQASIQQ